MDKTYKRKYFTIIFLVKYFKFTSISCSQYFICYFTNQFEINILIN